MYIEHQINHDDDGDESVHGDDEFGDGGAARRDDDHQQ
jgi:hypothetical protein